MEARKDFLIKTREISMIVQLIQRILIDLKYPLNQVQRVIKTNKIMESDSLILLLVAYLMIDGFALYA